MRRLMAITAFALFLAVPLWAQHGGGGGHSGGFGGGHAGGFGGGHGGGFAGHSGFSGGRGISGGSAPSVHAFSGIRSEARSGSVSRGFAAPSSRFSSSRFSSSRALSARAGFSRGPFLHDGFRNRGFGFRNFGFRNCIGFPCRGAFGWPGWYAGFYDPWWWWNSDYDNDQDYQDNLALAAQMNQQNLEEQQMLRQEEADGDQDAYASYASPRREEKQGAPVLPATVLVFRDQHRQEIDNYAIVGQTVWVFAPKQAERISLSDLDIPGTVKANEDRGVTFRVPQANEAQ
jgi:hypothetical protein